jgi:translation initiation factor IF-1
MPESTIDDMALSFYEDYQSPTSPSHKLSTGNGSGQVGTALEPYRPIVPAPANPFVSNVQSIYVPFEERDLIQTITTNPPQSDQWDADTLPWWFPRRRPDIAGSVMDVQSQQEDARASSSGSILRVIADIIWASAGTQQHGQEKEMVPIVVIRVRTEEGIQRIARFRGYLIKANLSLGDKVSLWGKRRGGVLFVRRAYNHTARAVVSTRSTTPSIAFALISLLLLASVIAFILTHHVSLSFFLHLLSQGH